MSKDWIDERLRRKRPEHAAPVGFTARVMLNLPKRRAEREDRPVIFWPRLTVAVALMTIVGVFLFEFFGQSQQADQTASHVREPSIAPLPVTASTKAFFPERIEVLKVTPEQFGVLAIKLNQPLEKELDNMISDTKVAIQFVASNFLPEK
jgi:hypothetical protein